MPLTRRSSTSSRKVLPILFDPQQLQHDAYSAGRFSYEENDWNRKNFSDTNSSVFFLSTSNCCQISIRYCLLIVISSLILVSVFVISAIWLLSFAPSQYSLTSIARDRELMKMINYTNGVLDHIVYMSGMMADQLVVEDFNMKNLEREEKKLYSSYKSMRRFLSGVTISSYVGDDQNNGFGFIQWENGTAMVNTTPTTQAFYKCHDFENSKYCNRNQTPDSHSVPFNFSYLIDLCNKNPNKLLFSESYSDISMPNYTFVTCINCIYQSNNPSVSFDYYYAVDTTIKTISEMLQEQIKSIPHSRSFIVETKTNNLIATDDSRLSCSEWDENGKNIRMTPFDVSDKQINELAHDIRANWKNWNDLPCNVLELGNSGTYSFVLIYRLCTVSKIDWTFVLTVPRWNYISVTVIATLCAVIGSAIIVTIGIIIGAIVSLRIVKSFNNLIALFESVSNMDLDQLSVEPSMFTEIRKIQQTFSLMVYNIRLYKSFIPANLLLELEEGGEQETMTRLSLDSFSPRTQTSDSIELERSQPFSNTEDTSLEGVKGSKLANILDNKKASFKMKNKFSLYLEPRKITINQMYIEGLNEWLLSLEGNPTHVVSLLGDLFAQVDAVIRNTSGHLVNFENDILTIAYNTSINQSNHEEKAVSSALLLQEKLINVKENKWRESGLIREEIYELINFRFAICTQKTFCGNIGTKDIKHFTIFSSMRHNLDQLVRFAKKLKVQIIITHHIKQYCHTKCETRFLDRRELKEDYFFSSLDDFNQENWEIGSVSFSNSFTKDCLLYELGDTIDMKHETDDLHKTFMKERNLKWIVYNQACSLLFEGKFEEAIPYFKEFQNANPNDLPTQHLLRLCEQQAQTPTFNILE